MVIHDLKHPMESMISQLSSLREQIEEHREVLYQLKREGRRIQEMLQHLIVGVSTERRVSTIPTVKIVSEPSNKILVPNGETVLASIKIDELQISQESCSDVDENFSEQYELNEELQIPKSVQVKANNSLLIVSNPNRQIRNRKVEQLRCELF